MDNNNKDIIRIMRLIIYEGPRSVVEEHFKNVLHGSKPLVRNSKQNTIGKVTAITLDEFPEIINQHESFNMEMELIHYEQYLETFKKFIAPQCDLIQLNDDTMPYKATKSIDEVTCNQCLELQGLPTLT